MWFIGVRCTLLKARLVGPTSAPERLEALPGHFLGGSGVLDRAATVAAWDENQEWYEALMRRLSGLGIVPEVIAVEMTLSVVNPALASFRPMMERDLAAAEAAIAKLW